LPFPNNFQGAKIIKKFGSLHVLTPFVPLSTYVKEGDTPVNEAIKPLFPPTGGERGLG